MRRSNIITAKTMEDTISLLSERKGEARLIAGGTDLMIEIRNGKVDDSLKLIIDIDGLSELAYVRESDGVIHVGAGLRHADCVSNELLREKAPLLPLASGWVGSPQIRNRGTIGGNIVTAAACADTVPALVAMDGTCILARKDENGAVQTREVLVSDFITGVGTVGIEDDELLTEVRFPVPDPKLKAAYEKLVRRNALVKARMTIAVLGYTGSDGKIGDVKISLGSVTPKPMRFRKSEDLLIGKKPAEELYREAAEKMSAEMIKQTGYRWSTEYKKPVAEALTMRALRKVLRD